MFLPEAPAQAAVRRRSEVDRKLDALVGSSGKLREPSPAAIVKFLRLFNLCDFSSGLQAAPVPVPAPGPAPLVGRAARSFLVCFCGSCCQTEHGRRS